MISAMGIFGSISEGSNVNGEGSLRYAGSIQNTVLKMKLVFIIYRLYCMKTILITWLALQLPVGILVGHYLRYERVRLEKRKRR